MHGRRRVTRQERVRVVVPDDAAVGGLDDAGLARGDESAVGVVEVGGVVERQVVQVLAVGGFDDGDWGLGVHDSERYSPDRQRVGVWMTEWMCVE